MLAARMLDERTRARASRHAGPVKPGTLRASVIDTLRMAPQGMALPEIMDVAVSGGSRAHTQKGVLLILRQHGTLGADGAWTLVG